MGNCLPSSNYITPAPRDVLPDPSGPSSFTIARNACMSCNYNVYKSSATDDNPPLWLFLHVKGVPNGSNNSYLVLENFWRPPFSDEGDVLCWCHLPSFQRNGAYRSSGHEEYGVSSDLYSEIYWSNALFSQDPESPPMLLWMRREWSFFTKIGFYRDRYMEEPLGILEVSSKGWSIHRTGSQFLQQCSKEVKEVRYVFRDKQGLRFPIELDMSRGKDSLRVMSLDSSLFTCTVTPSCSWVGNSATLSVSTRPAIEASLGVLLGFVCGSVLSPQSILSNLRISQTICARYSCLACSCFPKHRKWCTTPEPVFSPSLSHEHKLRKGYNEKNKVYRNRSFLESKPKPILQAFESIDQQKILYSAEADAPSTSTGVASCGGTELVDFAVITLSLLAERRT